MRADLIEGPLISGKWKLCSLQYSFVQRKSIFLYKTVIVATCFSVRSNDSIAAAKPGVRTENGNVDVAIIVVIVAVTILTLPV